MKEEICANKCENEICQNFKKEYLDLNEEIANLENKCLILDYVKSQQLNEMTNEIANLNEKISNMIDRIENNEGYWLEYLEYSKLNEVEENLIILYSKIKNKIREVNL